MPTLQDIANEVGVSTATVSNVLRGRVKGAWPKSAAQAQRVRDVANHLGYRVDWRARALKTKRTRMIGLLHADRPEGRVHDPGLIEGVVTTLDAHDYHLVFVRVAEGSPKHEFADARFDGLLIDYRIEASELELVRRTKLPAVIINAPAPDGLISVTPDHRAAGRLAADHLIALGHRRIGFLRASRTEEARWPTHMVHGWRQGIAASLRNAGLTHALIDLPAAERVDGETPEDYGPALSRSFEGANRPTAVVAINPDRAAEVVLPWLDRLGLTCPHDVSLISMGDERALGWCRPGITSVALPFPRLGQAAALRLLALLEKGQATNNRVRDSDTDVSCPPARLINRGSTAAPPGYDKGLANRC